MDSKEKIALNISKEISYNDAGTCIDEIEEQLSKELDFIETVPDLIEKAPIIKFGTLIKS